MYFRVSTIVSVTLHLLPTPPPSGDEFPLW